MKKSKSFASFCRWFYFHCTATIIRFDMGQLREAWLAGKDPARLAADHDKLAAEYPELSGEAA